MNKCLYRFLLNLGLCNLAVNTIMSLAIIDDQLIYLLHADINSKVAQRKTNYCICIAAFLWLIKFWF